MSQRQYVATGQNIIVEDLAAADALNGILKNEGYNDGESPEETDSSTYRVHLGEWGDCASSFPAMLAGWMTCCRPEAYVELYLEGSPFGLEFYRVRPGKAFAGAVSFPAEAFLGDGPGRIANHLPGYGATASGGCEEPPLPFSLAEDGVDAEWSKLRCRICGKWLDREDYEAACPTFGGSIYSYSCPRCGHSGSFKTDEFVVEMD